MTLSQRVNDYPFCVAEQGLASVASEIQHDLLAAGAAEALAHSRDLAGAR